MSWSDTFLGVIAAATLVMALIQLGAIVSILRLARQTQTTMADMQREVRPILAKVSTVADEASRTATIAFARWFKKSGRLPRRTSRCCAR